MGPFYTTVQKKGRHGSVLHNSTKKRKKKVDIDLVYSRVKKGRHRSGLHRVKKKTEIDPVYTRSKNRRWSGIE